MTILRRARELALAAAATVVGLALVEGGLRIKARREDRRLLDRAMAVSARPRPGTVVTLGNMIRPSASPDIIYELWPEMDVLFPMSRPDGAPGRVRTNGAGFRDRDHSIAKPPGAFRILGIGDSLMFGWGVEEGESYLARLEQRLRQERPGRDWEVLNTGVPGYNTVMEVATLKEKGLAYQPDLVVVGFCPNDASLPNFVQAERNVFSMRESFLASFVSGRLRAPAASADALLAASARADGVLLEDDPARVPPRYRHHVGWEAFRLAMQELKQLGAAHHFDTIVLAFVPGGAPEKLKGLAIARELGFPVLDVGERQRQYQVAHGLQQYFGSSLTVGDGHPSALSHDLAADELLGAVRARLP